MASPERDGRRRRSKPVGVWRGCPPRALSAHHPVHRRVRAVPPASPCAGACTKAIYTCPLCSFAGVHGDKPPAGGATSGGVLAPASRSRDCGLQSTSEVAAEGGAQHAPFGWVSLADLPSPLHARPNEAGHGTLAGDASLTLMDVVHARRLLRQRCHSFVHTYEANAAPVQVGELFSVQGGWWRHLCDAVFEDCHCYYRVDLKTAAAM